MFDWLQPERYHKITDGDEIELLMTVNDEAVLCIVRGMLEEENIPYLVRERNGRAVAMYVGFSMCGADIFVPADALEKAKELVAGIEGETVTFVDEEGNELEMCNVPKQVVYISTNQNLKKGDSHADK